MNVYTISRIFKIFITYKYNNNFALNNNYYNIVYYKKNYIDLLKILIKFLKNSVHIYAASFGVNLG